MEFRSIADLSATVTRNLHKIPSSVDLVVGVPRSGMLPASMIALALNLPLTDLEGYIEGKIFRSGSSRGQKTVSFCDLKHALVVDDSVRTGATMDCVRRQLSARSDLHFTLCAAYGLPFDNHDKCDFVLENVADPRVFEWNVMHHPWTLASACVDIDGILCADPKREDNDDGEKYRSYISCPDRRFTPTAQIDCIVTSRLEKYRDITEAWLNRAGIQYRKLYMLPLKSAEDRRKMGNHADFKAQVYASTNTRLFIESEAWQAAEIARICGKPVLCLDENPRILRGSLLTPRGLYWRIRQSRRARNLVKGFRRAFGVQRRQLRAPL